MTATKLFAVLAVCAVAACNDKPAPSAAPPAPAPATPVVEQHQAVSSQVALPVPQIELPQQQAFTLVSAGSGARTALRYALAAGAFDARVETHLATRTFTEGAWSQVAQQPAAHDGFAVTIGQNASLLALRALPGEPGSIWEKLLGNRRMTASLDARGQLGELRFADDPTREHSAAAYDEAMQRLLGVIVPLPDAAVGDGASWRVVTALRQSGAVVKQTATYTLVAHTADGGWKLHVQIRRDAQPQPLDAAIGSQIQLVAIFRQLEGDLVVSPARPIGTGKLTVESRVHARVTPENQPAVEQLAEDTGTLTLQ